MWHVREREQTSQPEYSRSPSSSMELIAIPNGLAGCKRKIEFDRCRWERKDGRKNERRERVVAQVWHDRLIGCIHAAFVVRRWKRGQQRGEGREGDREFSPEGRKEGSRAIRDRKSNQLGKGRDISHWEARGRVRLRTFGDNYRRADSIPHYVGRENA